MQPCRPCHLKAIRLVLLRVCPLRSDIFPENVAKSTYKTGLPTPQARVDKTPQPVHCYSLLSTNQKSVSPTCRTVMTLRTRLSTASRESGSNSSIPSCRDRCRCLVEQLVRTFSDDPHLRHLLQSKRLFSLSPFSTVSATATCSLASTPTSRRVLL
jgi:hypothetical protein